MAYRSACDRFHRVPGYSYVLLGELDQEKRAEEHEEIRGQLQV